MESSIQKPEALFPSQSEKQLLSVFWSEICGVAHEAFPTVINELPENGTYSVVVAEIIDYIKDPSLYQGQRDLLFIREHIARAVQYMRAELRGAKIPVLPSEDEFLIAYLNKVVAYRSQTAE